MNVEPILIVAAVAVLGATVWFAAASPRTIAGDVAVPTKTSFGLSARTGQADGTMAIDVDRPVQPGLHLLVDVRGGRVFEPEGQPAKREAAGIRLAYTRNRSLIDWSDSITDDFGTYAGAVVRGSGGGLQDGLRLSPCRLLYGTIAPDALAGLHQLGAGLSFYPPPDLVGDAFSHWGGGIAHCYRTDDRTSATVAYLAFSTHF